MTSRSSPRWFVVFFAMTLATGAALPAGEPVVRAPGEHVPRSMLAREDQEVIALRQDVVEAALDAFPGSIEALLLLLVSERYQDALWAGEEGVFGPLDPGAARLHNGGRNFAIQAFSGPDSVAQVGLQVAGLRYEPYETAFVSPLILDLRGDGLDVRGGEWRPHPGPLDFTGLLVADINGDGFEELTEWVGPTDALLVDPEDPAKLTLTVEGPVWNGPWSGRDLVGSAEGYRDGFVKLLRRDADGDGVVRGSELDGLYVWQDLDGDARMDRGELSTVAARGISEIAAPEGDARNADWTGSYRMGDRTGAVRDWWPSYAIARKRLLEPGPVPAASSLELAPRSLPATPGAERVLAAGNAATRRELEAAGIDWETVALAAVSPDGAWAVLLDRGVTAADVSEGRASVLWAVRRRDEMLVATPHWLRYPQIDGLVLDGRKAMLWGGNGAALLEVDLTSGEQSVLHEVTRGAAGFRMTGRFWRTGGTTIFCTGYFHDAEQRMLRESIARFFRDGDTWTIVELTAVDDLRACAREVGEIRGEHLVSPDLAYFVVRSAADGVSALVACRDGEVEVIDGPVRLGGIAASGEQVLYVRQSGDIDEVVLHDLASGEKTTFAAGRDHYALTDPVGTGTSRIGVTTEVDWGAGRLRYHTWAWTDSGDQRAEDAPRGGGVAAGDSVFLETEGIGTFRLSDDGSTYAYLGPEGLRFAPLPAAEAPRFLRGNADGSPLPALARRAIELTDAVYLLRFLFMGGPAPPCLDAADGNDSGVLDLSDGVTILRHLFSGRPRELLAPWPEPGPDPTPDELGCEVPQG